MGTCWDHAAVLSDGRWCQRGRNEWTRTSPLSDLSTNAYRLTSFGSESGLVKVEPNRFYLALSCYYQMNASKQWHQSALSLSWDSRLYWSDSHAADYQNMSSLIPDTENLNSDDVNKWSKLTKHTYVLQTNASDLSISRPDCHGSMMSVIHWFRELACHDW